MIVQTGTISLATSLRKRAGGLSDSLALCVGSNNLPAHFLKEVGNETASILTIIVIFLACPNNYIVASYI